MATCMCALGIAAAASGWSTASVLAISAICFGQPAHVDIVQGRLAQGIDAYVQPLADFGFAGSVLIQKGHEIILDKGYGEAAGKKLDGDTRIWIASLTKTFAAAAILKLCDQGKLTVDARLDSIFATVPEEKRAITIHQLMTFTSGLPDSYASDHIVSMKESLQTILSLPMAPGAGAKFQYSANAFNLLALIIEKLSGMHYEEFLEKNLFVPAGLKDTGFWGTSSAGSVAPTPNKPAIPITLATWGYRGSTGIYSTTHDLLRWMSALYGGRLISAASVKAMFTMQFVARKDVGYGYGVIVDEHSYGHREFRFTGLEDFGHNGVIRFFPSDGTAVIILCCSGEAPTGAWSQNLATKLLPKIFGVRYR